VRAEAAPEAERLAAMESAREEIRRVLMGYDVDTERGEKLAAFLEATLPGDLSESFRWELAAVRHELRLFADIERLFSRAPLPRPTGEAGPSSRAILLDAVRRYREGGGWLPDGFRENLRSSARSCACSRRRPRPSCGGGSCSAASRASTRSPAAASRSATITAWTTCSSGSPGCAVT
jgi:hypothetical protein